MIVLVIGTRLLAAQETPEARERVQVFVTASTDRAAFVAHGSNAGLAPGDRVLFFPAGGTVEGVVREVTSNNARIELLADSEPLVIGTRGEVWITPPGVVEDAKDPAVDEEEEANAPAVIEPARPAEEAPDHPPWQSPPEDWDASTPLLSPANSTSLAQRERSIQGRAWAGARWRSTQLNGHRESGYLRTGVAWTMSNPFLAGGELRFDGEVYGRYTDTGDGFKREQENLRLSQLAYRHGDQRESSRTYLVGRFYQEAMPEFGPLDGVEFSQRLGTEDELGTSAGHQPRRTGEISASGDYQASVFHRHRSTSAAPLDWRVGYQKTWHDGTQDRDLLLLDSSFRSRNHAFVNATAWIDFYEADEVQKDDQVELTRLFVAAGKNGVDGDGWRLSYSEFRFPLLLRQEFDPAIDTDLYEKHNNRIGLDAWTRFEQGTRLRGRVDRWADDDAGGAEGVSGEVRCDVPRALPAESELGVALFGSHGVFSENAGLRLSALGYRGASFWNLAWELQWIQEESQNTPTPRTWQHQVYASYDTQVFQDFSLSIDLSASWGDQGDTLGLGIYMQRSF